VGGGPARGKGGGGRQAGAGPIEGVLGRFGKRER